DGSCTDQLASASAMAAASDMNMMPQISRHRRPTAPLRSSDQNANSMLRPTAAIVIPSGARPELKARCHASESCSAQHRHQAMQCLGGGFLVLNERHADV